MPAPDHADARAATAGRSWRRRLLRTGRLALVLVTGGALCLLGFVLLFLPGPGVPALVCGLTVLATEFAWAERLLRRLRDRVRRLATRPSWTRRLRPARPADVPVVRYGPAVDRGAST